MTYGLVGICIWDKQGPSQAESRRVVSTRQTLHRPELDHTNRARLRKYNRVVPNHQPRCSDPLNRCAGCTLLLGGTYNVVLFCFVLKLTGLALPDGPDGRIGRGSKRQERVNPAPLNGEK